MEKIVIKNLRLRCMIGINLDEQKEKQDILINATIWADLSKAGRTDSIRDTVNYQEINDRIIGIVEGSRFNLAESLADKIADACLSSPMVERVRIRVEKPKALKSAESVGVEITKEIHAPRRPSR